MAVISVGENDTPDKNSNSASIATLETNSSGTVVAAATAMAITN